MKKLFLFLVLVFVLFSCNSNYNNQEKVSMDSKQKLEKIQIITSIVPLASISNYIGWDFVEAKSLMPAGISPHSFDLKPSQIVDIEKSSLIVYLDIDHIDWFINKAIDWKANVVAVKKGIELLDSIGDEHHEDEHHEDGHHEEWHSIDPHIWWNSQNAYLIASTILNELVKISPENKDYFNSNLKLFKSELDKIKNDFEQKVKWKTQADFIIFHDAYNYLFSELNLDNSKKHIFRKNVLNNPNSNEMKKLIDEIKNLKIKLIFREPQFDSNSLKKVAFDYDLSIFVLDPLWNDESKYWYIKNYKDNLKSLEKIYE